MKIGFNLLLWTGHVTERHLPLLRDIKRSGYDGVETKGGPAPAEQAPSGRELLAPDQSVAHCEDSPGTMDGGEE